MVDPSGPLSNSMAGLRDLVAASPTFQAVVGAADATAALNSIFYPANLVQVPGAKRPWALITDDHEADWEMDAQGHDFGALLLSLEFPVPDDLKGSDADAILDFRNNAGAILTEMRGLARTPKPDGSIYFYAWHFRKVVTPARCNPKDFNNEDFCGGAWLVSYR